MRCTRLDIASAKPKDSVVATLPRPGVPLTAGQSVVVVASNGNAPKEPSSYVVPEGILGSQASDAERLLKEGGVAVKKVAITSPRAKDTIVATYPAPGKIAEARSCGPGSLHRRMTAADRLNMLDLFLVNSPNS